MRKTGKGIISVILFFLISIIPIYPSEGILNIYAQVDSNKVDIKDTLKLTVTIDAENVKKIPAPELPELKSFTILNESTKTQTSVSIVNGKTTKTRTISYTYILKPDIKGTFTIDPVTIRYKGEVLQTEPITVIVVEGYGKPDERGYLDEDSSVNMEKLKKDLFILTKPENSKVYVGEQVKLTYTLYTRLDIDNISIKQSPDFSGFFKEDIFNALKLENKKENYNGKSYDTTLLKKVVLFPLKPGNFTPDPLILEATVIVKDNDLLDMFGIPYNFNIESNPITIYVKPLPEMNIQLPFSHIVGDLKAQISLRDNSINTGESTTSYLTLKSTGNLGGINEPGIILSKKGRVYLSDTINDRMEEGDSIYFIKKFEYTIIPEENGTLTVNSKEILYFDSSTNSYTKLEAEPAQIYVTGKDITDERPQDQAKKTMKVGGLHYLKGDLKKLGSRANLPPGPYFFYLYHIILITTGGLLFLLKIKREKQGNLLKKKKAYSIAMEILKKSRENMSKKNYGEDTINLIYHALSTYLSSALDKRTQDISVKNIERVLGENVFLMESTKKSIVEIIKKGTMLRFSPTKIGNEEICSTLYDKTLSVIEDIESLSRGRLFSLEKNNKG